MMGKAVLPPAWGVPQIFRSRLGDEVGRQRVMSADGHLLLVLHAPPEPDDPKRTGRYFWRAPDGAWKSSALGNGPEAIAKHLMELAEILEKHDRREEAAASAEEYFAILNAMSPLHRLIRNLHQVLEEARKLSPEDRGLINFRDRSYELDRTAELLYSEVKNSLEFLVARQAEEQAWASHEMAHSAYRLNLLAAFFFPLATLSAVFGTNLKSGLEALPPPGPLLLIAMLGLACGVVLTAFIARKPARMGAARAAAARQARSRAGQAAGGSRQK